MVKVLAILLLGAFSLPSNNEILTWIANGAPSELSQTMALAQHAEELIAASGDRNVALILPTNAAWAKHQKDYQNLQTNPGLGLNLLLDAAIEVADIGSVNSIKDIKATDYITLGGTPLIADPKDSSKFYFGEYKDDGSLRKVGQPIKIKSKPVAKFAHVLIFEATSFSMPPSIGQL